MAAIASTRQAIALSHALRRQGREAREAREAPGACHVSGREFGVGSFMIRGQLLGVDARRNCHRVIAIADGDTSNAAAGTCMPR
ncbi:hypothetical protein AT395_00585 [Pandoraea apista]|nr:hypothetical protein AT395_00585 [Pandoraea apista]